MHVVIIIICIILWAILQGHIADSTGQAPRSRSSHRAQRRKARKLGMSFEDVPYTPRDRPAEPFKFSASTNRKLLIATVVIWAVLLGEPIVNQIKSLF